MRIHITSKQWGKVKRKTSVSEKIRQKKSKRIKVIRKVKE